MEEQKYLHLSPDRLEDLQNVGSTVEQLFTADQNAKKEIDRRLATYCLSYQPKDGLNEGTNIKLGVIGTSGSGKSATGNTLLQEKTFAESTSAIPKTTTFEGVQSMLDRLLTVADTPGSWSVPNSKEHQIDLYVLTINLASPRFGKKDLDILHKLKDYNNIIESKRCIVLLTHASDALQDKSLYEYVQEIKGDPLYDLIMKDMEGWRVMAINNNCDTKYEADKQHEMIVKLLQRIYRDANFDREHHHNSVWINACYCIIILCCMLLLGVWLYVWYVGLVHPQSRNSTTVAPNVTIAETTVPGTFSPGSGTSGTYSQSTVTTTPGTGDTTPATLTGTGDTTPATLTGTGDTTPATPGTGTTGNDYPGTGTRETHSQETASKTSGETKTRKIKSGG